MRDLLVSHLVFPRFPQYLAMQAYLFKHAGRASVAKTAHTFYQYHSRLAV